MPPRQHKQTPEERAYLEREGRIASTIDQILEEISEFPDDHPIVRQHLQLARRAVHEKAIVPETLGGSDRREQRDRDEDPQQ